MDIILSEEDVMDLRYESYTRLSLTRFFVRKESAFVSSSIWIDFVSEDRTIFSKVHHQKSFLDTLFSSDATEVLEKLD
jgi:hypothetical protein